MRECRYNRPDVRTRFAFNLSVMAEMSVLSSAISLFPEEISPLRGDTADISSRCESRRPIYGIGKIPDANIRAE